MPGEINQREFTEERGALLLCKRPRPAYHAVARYCHERPVYALVHQVRSLMGAELLGEVLYEPDRISGPAEQYAMGRTISFCSA